MQPSSDPEERRSEAVPDLIVGVLGHARALLQAEWRLAKHELRNSAGQMTRAATFFVLAGLFGLVAFHALAVAAVLGLVALGLSGWLAALTTTLAVICLAVVCALMGRASLKSERLIPQRTLAHLRADYTTAKETFNA